MGAKPPVDYGAVGHAGERLVQAHRFFSEQAREWLERDGPEHVEARAMAIETVARELLQMVVIDLAAEENAQEIFETLNARGAQLTAADLIKNFVFQRLFESVADIEDAYEQYWKKFEAAFWETEISVGRLRAPRSSVFLNHWLIARTGEEVVAREVFPRFKRYADEVGTPMLSLLKEIDRAADVYRSFVLSGTDTAKPGERLGFFGYRTGVLESEVVKPLILCLLDPEADPISFDQLTKALDVVESWMVRRMLVRATTKNYNQVVAELILELRRVKRASAGDAIEAFLASQTSDSRYWPDDKELRDELHVLPAYRRLRRGRLRMVLEAIEDYKRGWKAGQVGLGGERVARGKYVIEHVMPRKWAMHWPLPEGANRESERDHLIHTIGNLTLLTSRLNAKVSNGPWLGENGKRHGLESHDVLLLNRELLKKAVVEGIDEWTDEKIRSRSEELAEIIIKIWPAPAGHRSGFSKERARPKYKVDLSDLLSADWLKQGQSLFVRRQKSAEPVATLLPDGRIDIQGVLYSRPSEAAKSVTKRPTNGWWYFLVDQKTRRSLRDVRRDYLESFAVDLEADEDDDGDDE
jgi:hypothetical protein